MSRLITIFVTIRGTTQEVTTLIEPDDSSIDLSINIDEKKLVLELQNINSTCKFIAVRIGIVYDGDRTCLSINHKQSDVLLPSMVSPEVAPEVAPEVSPEVSPEVLGGPVPDELPATSPVLNSPVSELDELPATSPVLNSSATRIEPVTQCAFVGLSNPATSNQDGQVERDPNVKYDWISFLRNLPLFSNSGVSHVNLETNLELLIGTEEFLRCHQVAAQRGMNESTSDNNELQARFNALTEERRRIAPNNPATNANNLTTIQDNLNNETIDSVDPPALSAEQQQELDDSEYELDQISQTIEGLKMLFNRYNAKYKQLVILRNELIESRLKFVLTISPGNYQYLIDLFDEQIPDTSPRETANYAIIRETLVAIRNGQLRDVICMFDVNGCQCPACLA